MLNAHPAVAESAVVGIRVSGAGGEEEVKACVVVSGAAPDPVAPLDWCAETPADVAAILEAQQGLGLTSNALVVANPVPEDQQLDPAVHDRVLHESLARLREQGVAGKTVTPYLLEHFRAATGGESLRVNEAIIRANARLAAQIARAI